MDVWEYFMQKERDFDAWGVVAEPTGRGQEIFRAEEGSDDQRGFIFAKLALTEDLYVSVYERVVVQGNNIHREAYAYSLIADEAQVAEWDRDPKNHPDSPVHEHEGPDRERREHTEPVTLRDVVERGWEEVSLRAEAPLDADDDHDAS